MFSILLGMCSSINELFFSFIMEVHIGVNEVWDASTYVKEEYYSVVEVKVQAVGHCILQHIVVLTTSITQITQSYLKWGRVTNTKIMEYKYSTAYNT